MSPASYAASLNWNGSWDQSRDYIIGGVTVPDTDVIAATTVAIVNKTDDGMSLCTGSIIDTDLIVTAGHCVGPDKNNMRVVFRRDLQSSGTVVAVAGYVRPDTYGQNPNDVDEDDIALIRFEGGLPRGYQVATLLDDRSKLQDGKAVTLAGYGITTGTPDPFSDDDGAGTLRKVDVTIRNAQYGKTEVAMDQTQGKGACHGDSGGPAFIKSGGKYLLFGVTSRGPSDVPDHCDTIGIYTNILAHLDFVQAATTQLRGEN